MMWMFLIPMLTDITCQNTDMTVIWHTSGYMEIFGIMDSGSVLDMLTIIYPDAFDNIPVVSITYDLTDKGDSHAPVNPIVISDNTRFGFRVVSKENVNYNWRVIGLKAEKPSGYVKITPTSLVLTVGETYSLTASVQGFESDVTWESLDTGICTVNSSGIVTGVGIGGTLIKVSSVVGGKTALCMIAVRRMDL